MKVYFKFALLIAVIITGILAISAQDSQVLYGGVKVVSVSKGDKLSKHLKGVDKMAIRKLIIKDDTSNPYVSPHFCDDFLKVLSQLPNLETIDASGSEAASWELAFNDDFKIRDINTKRIIINNIRKKSERFQINDIGYYLGEYIGNDNQGRYIIYPQIEELIIKNIGWRQTDIFNDSLFFNLNYNGFTPILLPKDNALSFKRISLSNHPYHIIIGSCDFYDRERRITTADGIKGLQPNNSDLNGVVFCDNSFIQQLDVDTLVIPSTVRGIIRSSNSNYKGKANVIVFEDGDLSIIIENESLTGLDINKSVIFNRPVTVQYGFRDLDSIIFNKAVTLSKDELGYFNGVSNIRNIIFNDDANIDNGCGGSGHGLVVFKDKVNLKENAFGHIETIRFEQVPNLQPNYAKPRTVYVPEGFKSRISGTGTNATVYEIVKEQPIKESRSNSLPFRISTYKSGEIMPLNISAIPLSKNNELYVSLCQKDFWKYIGKGEISDLDKTIYKGTPEYDEQYKSYQEALNGLFYEVIPCKAYDFTTSGANVYQRNQDEILGSSPLLHIPQDQVGEYDAGRRDCALPLKNTCLIKHQYDYAVKLPIKSTDINYLSYLQHINECNGLGLLCIIKPGIQVNSDFGSYNFIGTPIGLYLIDKTTNSILEDLTQYIDTDNPSKYKNIFSQREAKVNAEKKKQTDAAIKDYKRKYGANASPCATCAGTGRKTYTSSTTGQQYKKVCNVCGGSGRIYKR